ncbi:MAG: serine protease [Campylobacteraceae bacterium 4484_166]|nr:MAG: serine protease [Campylobacteraceae bacterium 4484_166]
MKIIIMIFTVVLFLHSQSITFDKAVSNPHRIYPNNSSSILSYSTNIKNIKNSIVNISTQEKINNQRVQREFNDPFFEQFFGKQFHRRTPRQQIKRSLGSGVILSKDGYIVTNAHVVKSATKIMVSIGDTDKQYEAKLIGVDIDSDIGVIKIKHNNLKPIKVGSSDHLEVGDVVFAIGNPFGVGQTVTKGIISALNKDRVGINKYENFIQTDASINPGNSGGALVDSRGVLIGINSAIVSRGGGNNGIGFAIPVTMVKNIAQKLIKYGKVTRGYLGVSIKNLNKEVKPLYTKEQGAIIIDVAKGSSAEKYGLQRGDLVYQINNKTIKDANDFMRAIGSHKPNDRVLLYIERDKNNKIINVKLGSKNSPFGISNNKNIFDGAMIKYNKDKNNIQITKIKPNSKADKLGLIVGDIIVQIEAMEIRNYEDIKKATKRYKNKTKRVYIRRGSQIYMIIAK